MVCSVLLALAPTTPPCRQQTLSAVTIMQPSWTQSMIQQSWPTHCTALAVFCLHGSFDGKHHKDRIHQTPPQPTPPCGRFQGELDPAARCVYSIALATILEAKLLLALLVAIICQQVCSKERVCCWARWACLVHFQHKPRTSVGSLGGCWAHWECAWSSLG